MSKQNGETESQKKALEYVNNGYQAGVVSIASAMVMLKEAGFSATNRLALLESMAYERGKTSQKHDAQRDAKSNA